MGSAFTVGIIIGVALGIVLGYRAIKNHYEGLVTGE
jgi:galactitol-specific phosphotransferase system IIC component